MKRGEKKILFFFRKKFAILIRVCKIFNYTERYEYIIMSQLYKEHSTHLKKFNNFFFFFFRFVLLFVIFCMISLKKKNVTIMRKNPGLGDGKRLTARLMAKDKRKGDKERKNFVSAKSVY